MRSMPPLNALRAFEAAARTGSFKQAALELQVSHSISDGTRLLTHVTREDILTVRMYSTVAVRWLVSRLDRFQDRHPDLQVRRMTSQLDTAVRNRCRPARLVAVAESRR